MEWLTFWPLETLAELIVTVVVVMAFVIVWVLPNIIKQYRCRHDGGFYETRACNAICRQCSKNLGFIGNLRDKK